MAMDANWVNRLMEELTKPLPGIEAQLRMSPRMRSPFSGNRLLKNSGVLLLLYPHEGIVFTVFIKRAEYSGIHSGQVSLPGGMFKKNDVVLSRTALREAREEICIALEEVRIIGQLTSLHIPVSNTLVFPFVAITEKRPEFAPDPREVQYIIETKLDDLLDPLNQKEETMQIAGMPLEVPYYDIHGHHIWGATAMIVSEFLEVMRKTMC